MQTHFTDLNLLLYDFLGFMVILGTLAYLLPFSNTYGRANTMIYYTRCVMHSCISVLLKEDYSVLDILLDLSCSIIVVARHAADCNS
jgi:hypothetical protein